MGRRPGLSTVLVLGAIVLVVAIFVGQSMGNRVLGAIASKTGGESTPIPIPSSSALADTVTSRALWKRRQVLSVATDPAFPDPRITPEPEIPATPRPRPKPTPAPADTNVDRTDFTPAPARTPNTNYTSPGLAAPLATHNPDETSAPDEGPSGAPRASARPQTTPPRGQTPRPFPSLPPVSFPSLSP